MNSLPEHLRQVEGYRLYLPKTMAKHNYAHMVLLVKLPPDLMHEDIASIWVSILVGNRSIMKVGGIYREHRLMLQPKPNVTKTDQAQLERWNIFLQSWKKAAKTKMCLLIGDTNLDYKKWQCPDRAHAKMVEKTKLEIESLGFVQIIKNITRTCLVRQTHC